MYLLTYLLFCVICVLVSH